MSQLSLFDSRDEVLVDDDRGRITYTPCFIETKTASSWFAELRETTNWHAQRRMMYDREVDVPRLVGHYKLDPAAAATPPSILDALQRVTQHLNVSFNSVGLNLYRDGRDSVAPHNDHLNELVEGFPIALVSLGATRRMTIRAKAEPRRTLNIDLEAGSLLVMDYATQLHYTHGVPKTRDAAAERISLAFRVKRRTLTEKDGQREAYA